MKKFPKWVFIIAGIFIFILCVIIGSCSAEKSKQVGDITIDPNLIFTQVAGTVYMDMTKEAQSNATPTPEIMQVSENKVIFWCPDCEGIYIILWQSPDGMGNSDNHAYHLDECILLDKAMSSEGIEKVKLECPFGTGWTRADAIQNKE